MKLQFTVILVFLIQVAGFTQMNSSWDIIAGVDYSYRYLSATESGPQSVVKVRNEIESGKLNWRLGFNFNKRITVNTFFKTGLRLASVGYVYKKEDLTWGPNEPEPINTVRISDDFWFIEIPLVVRFENAKNKFSPFLEIGISPSVYLSTLVSTKYDSEKTIGFRRGVQFHEINNFHLVSTFAFGANYNYSEKVQFFAQPTLRFHLTRLVKAPVNAYLYNAGLEMGVRWRL